MRKIILFILALGQMSFVVAQSLVVTGDTSFTGNLVTQIDHHLNLKNTSSNAITVKCQKTNLTLPSGAESYYCFANNCYSASSIIPSDSVTLAAGQQISFNNFPSDLDAHSGYYNAYGTSGIAKVRYCFYDENNPTDETCVTITYDCVAATSSWNCDEQGNCTDPGDETGMYTDSNTCQISCLVAINEEILNVIQISDFYPNPANSLTNFTFNGIKAQLKIIDILGNEVKIIQLEQPGIKRIDLIDMSKGIYFGKLMVNDKATTIKKLIVK